MGPRREKLVFNSVLNFRRVTQFWLCLLETQVRTGGEDPPPFLADIICEQPLIIGIVRFYECIRKMH